MASRKKLLVMAAAIVVMAALLSTIASAAKYKVGDGVGWDTGVDYDTWARGKKFVFRYVQAEHDVVVVDTQGYSDCMDHVVLGQAGQFFFICDAEGHYNSDMKLAINIH